VRPLSHPKTSPDSNQQDFGGRIEVSSERCRQWYDTRPPEKWRSIGRECVESGGIRQSEIATAAEDWTEAPQGVHEHLAGNHDERLRNDIHNLQVASYRLAG